MNLLANWKKAAAALAAAVMLTGSFTVPALAHGHGSSHHSSSGYYCTYHGTTHRAKTSCSKYCKTHRTVHTNGARHHLNHH